MKKVFLIISSFLGILALGLIIWISMAGPVLVEWYYGINFGAICDPPFVVLNPFRDKEVENVADEFLRRLKTGDLEVLNESVPDAERRDHIRTVESSSKIRSWFSASRTRTPEKVDIEYWVERVYEGGCQSMPANIELKRIDGDWLVTGYNPTY